MELLLHKHNCGRKKKFFWCNKVKRRGNQCDAGIYLLFDSTTDEVILFRDKSHHTHDRVGTRDPTISNEVKKEAIKDLFQLKLKPKAIIEALYERGMAAPTIKQLNNFLTILKSKRLGPTAISLGEIEQWCVEASKTVPESDDTPFIVSYQIVYGNDNDDDDDDKDVDDDDVNENKFRFFISTKRLLQIAPTAKKIHADATYKLVWQGFPVLVIGTSDLDRHFHSFGLAVCSDEKKIGLHVCISWFTRRCTEA